MYCQHPFQPIVFPNTAILILGTFPSLDSFKYDFYYAHPRNQFWCILADIFHTQAETTEQKTELLRTYRIGLWDIVASCERENSSDTNLKQCTLHDIPALLQQYPSITTIAFTGKKAAALYQKKYAHLHVKTITLPSPSPAYASMKYVAKREAYEKCFYNITKQSITIKDTL